MSALYWEVFFILDCLLAAGIKSGPIGKIILYISSKRLTTPEVYRESGWDFCLKRPYWAAQRIEAHDEFQSLVVINLITLKFYQTHFTTNLTS